MKEAFKNSIKNMYPYGCNVYQATELVKTYSMGYFDSLKKAYELTNDQKIADLLIKEVKEYKYLADEGWTTDETWKWW